MRHCLTTVLPIGRAAWNPAKVRDSTSCILLSHAVGVNNRSSRNCSFHRVEILCVLHQKTSAHCTLTTQSICAGASYSSGSWSGRAARRPTACFAGIRSRSCVDGHCCRLQREAHANNGSIAPSNDRSRSGRHTATVARKRISLPDAGTRNTMRILLRVRAMMSSQRPASLVCDARECSRRMSNINCRDGSALSQIHLAGINTRGRNSLHVPFTA